MRRRSALFSACAYGGSAGLLAFVALWLSSHALDSQPSPWYEAARDAALVFGLPASVWGGLVEAAWRTEETESGQGAGRGALVAALTAATAVVLAAPVESPTDVLSALVLAAGLAALTSPFGAAVGWILSRPSTRIA